MSDNKKPKMERVKATEHFYWDEFICPELYDLFKDRWHELIDPMVLVIAEWLRVETGKPIVINNWATGGQFKNSGVRSQECKEGAPNSAHKCKLNGTTVARWGTAADLKVQDYSEKDLYDLIKKNARDLFNKGLRQIEHYSLTVNPKTGEGWVHISTRATGKNCIQVIDLTKVVESWAV